MVVNWWKVVVFSATALVLCTSAHPTQNLPPPGSAKINDVVQRFYGPTEAERAQIDGLSRAAIEARIGRTKEFLEELQAIPLRGLAVPDAVDHEYFRAQLDSSLHHLEVLRRWENDPSMYLPFGEFYRPSVDPLLGDTERVEAMVRGFEQAPVRFQWAKENLKNPPLLWTEEAIKRCDGIQHFLDFMVPQIAEKTPTLKARLLKSAKDFGAHLGDYRAFLDRELRPRSTGSYVVGKANYERLLKNRSMHYDIVELIELGRTEHEKTRRLLEETARQIEPRKTWTEIFQENWLDFPAPWDLHRYLQQEAERARKLVYEKLVNVPAGSREEYHYIDAGHYRNRSRMGYGASAGFREGGIYATYYDLPSTDQYESLQDKIELMLDWNRGWILGTQISHEVYPGHHFQGFMASHNKRPARALTRNGLFTDVNSAWGEGWGVYCEELMHEYGYHQGNLRIRLTQLQNRFWRTARVIIDPSLHTGEMTYDEAVAVFMDAGLPEGGARLEATVVTRSPTREASYYIGSLEVRRLVEEARKLEGDRFNLKEFHTRLLLLGATPPALARKEILNVA
ncbi:MAG: DUF885 domain-containing protein, partial [Vicinamibacteria bacterium]